MKYPFNESRVPPQVTRAYVRGTEIQTQIYNDEQCSIRVRMSGPDAEVTVTRLNDGDETIEIVS